MLLHSLLLRLGCWPLWFSLPCLPIRRPACPLVPRQVPILSSLRWRWLRLLVEGGAAHPPSLLCDVKREVSERSCVRLRGRRSCRPNRACSHHRASYAPLDGLAISGDAESGRAEGSYVNVLRFALLARNGFSMTSTTPNRSLENC